jgi:hypothetical protein
MRLVYWRKTAHAVARHAMPVLCRARRRSLICFISAGRVVPRVFRRHAAAGVREVVRQDVRPDLPNGQRRRRGQSSVRLHSCTGIVLSHCGSSARCAVRPRRHARARSARSRTARSRCGWMRSPRRSRSSKARWMRWRRRCAVPTAQYTHVRVAPLQLRCLHTKMGSGTAVRKQTGILLQQLQRHSSAVDTVAAKPLVDQHAAVKAEITKLVAETQCVGRQAIGSSPKHCATRLTGHTASRRLTAARKRQIRRCAAPAA